MALKKTIAGYWKNPKTQDEWVPQQDVDMHPLEEAEIRAHWAVGDSLTLKPPKPSIQEEHEWLIEFGAAYVKQKRSEYEKDHRDWIIKHQPFVDAHRTAADAYYKWANDEHEKNMKKRAKDEQNRLMDQLKAKDKK